MVLYCRKSAEQTGMIVYNSISLLVSHSTFTLHLKQQTLIDVVNLIVIDEGKVMSYTSQLCIVSNKLCCAICMFLFNFQVYFFYSVFDG